MSWTILCFLKMFSVCLSSSPAHADTDISFLFDFLQQTNRPNYAVLENVCWSKEETQKLHRNLTMQNFKCKSVDGNSTIMTERYYEHSYIILVHVDCDFDTIWKQAAKGSLTFYPHIWILLGDFEKIKKKNVHIPMNSLLLSLVRTANYTKLETAYKIKKTVDWYIERTVGNWSPKVAMFDLEKVNIFKDRGNFMKVPLRVTYIITDNSTVNHFIDYRNKHVDNLTKINYVLYILIFDILNATQIRLFSRGWGFESRENNGSFASGMFQDLANDRSDIAGTLAFTPSSRLKYFRYIYPPAKDMDICLVFRAPSLAYYTNVFGLPFNNWVWVALGLQLLCGCVLIFIIFKWEWKVAQGRKENGPSFLDTAMMQARRYLFVVEYAFLDFR
ncbi:hypothetical protein HUJ04_004721 [Dendroctonus ponderosae]|uniref:Ionotropic receptor n=1 Tax=Dendroctonus ponderosae TaxID=77166 RepID=A0AAR5PU81_DENPD|nr:hypothetical protein HUJ04_004721 [Dendroctonus ponderosae]